MYSNASHLLLDDYLSAVDTHTATWIFEHCIKGLLLKGRTCILVTHNLTFAAADAQFLVALENGKVAAAGPPRDLARSGFRFLLVSSPTGNGDDEGIQRNNLSYSSTSLRAGTRPEKLKEKHDIIQQDSDQPGEGVSVIDEVERDEKLTWRDVMRYLASMGNWKFWSLLVFSFIGQQFGAIATNWWVRVLSDAYTEARQKATTGRPDRMRSGSSSSHSKLSPERINIAYYFSMYGLIIGLYMIVGLLKMLLVSFGSLQASAEIHRRLIKFIMNASFKFFNDTSFGQIISRFSTGLQTVDQHLAMLIIATLHFLGALTGIILLIAITTPSFLGPGVLISIAYYFIGAVYIVASRDLNELESIERTPLSQHISETLSGIATIRAFGAGQYSISNYAQIDRANRPSFFAAATERWLAIRLGLMDALVSLCAGSFAISSAGKLTTGAIGLSMSYAIVFSEHVLWLVRYHSSNLQNLTAYVLSPLTSEISNTKYFYRLQRVQEYIDLPQEAPAVMKNINLPEDWPSIKLKARYLASFSFDTFLHLNYL